MENFFLQHNNAHNDYRIKELGKDFPYKGYFAFLVLIELYAEQRYLSPKKDFFLFPKKVLRNQLSFKTKNLSLFLETLAKLELIKIIKEDAASFTISIKDIKGVIKFV